MKIAIIGYGKMGKTIETLALQAGHEIVLKINRANQDQLTIENLVTADVAIEFSRPEKAVQHLRLILDSGIPVVSGTTCWLADWESIAAYCHEKKGSLFHASNFSIGVYLFNHLNIYLTQLMHKHKNYQASIKEIHHTQKLDAPSGTAISLAQTLMKHYPEKTYWVNEEDSILTEEALPISSKRIDNVPGTHSISWDSRIDSIKIEHTAHSRQGFAEGALKAAEWILGKNGIFGMKDLMGF